MSSATVSVSLVIENPARLHEVATEDFIARAGSPEDAQDFLGTAEEPKLTQCLRQLYDRELPTDSGIAVQDSYAEMEDSSGASAAPRLSTILHVSTGHLTSEERHAVAKALGVGSDTSPAVHAEYNGLFLKPKDSGFFVRVPHDEALASFNLSPEMLRILELARSFDAWQVEFDADEEPLASLPLFGDRQLIIRDFATGQDQDDEPLYWSNTNGWVDRPNADRFFIEQAEVADLPMGGKPAWVDVEDVADAPYQLA